MPPKDTRSTALHGEQTTHGYSALSSHAGYPTSRAGSAARGTTAPVTRTPYAQAGASGSNSRAEQTVTSYKVNPLEHFSILEFGFSPQDEVMKTADTLPLSQSEYKARFLQEDLQKRFERHLLLRRQVLSFKDLRDLQDYLTRYKLKMEQYHKEASKKPMPLREWSHGKHSPWHKYIALWVDWWREVKDFHAKWKCLSSMQRKGFSDQMETIKKQLSFYGCNLKGKDDCNMASAFKNAGLLKTMTERDWDNLTKQQ